MMMSLMQFSSVVLLLRTESKACALIWTLRREIKVLVLVFGSRQFLVSFPVS